LAVHLARAGHDVSLWARDTALVAEMHARRANPVYLPDVHLPAAVRPTGDLRGALDNTRFVVVAVPSHGVREIARHLAPVLPADTVVVSATKGIEEGSLDRMSQVLEQELGGRIKVAVLSGPSFASELARQLPTAMAVASRDASVVDVVQDEFRSPYLRLYGTADVTGVEIGGALKNVIAIAAGLVEGLGLGHNAQAGLITRGLAEMTRLACAAGAQRETLAGLAGLGDLVLTCAAGPSRNRRVGVELAHGRPLQEILDGTRMVAEGVRTSNAALALAARYGTELPIASQVAELLAGRKSPRTALDQLMGRPQRDEGE
jgi:glycerol-3-phosphate dehydrogenase (NAD(P)+)